MPLQYVLLLSFRCHSKYSPLFVFIERRVRVVYGDGVYLLLLYIPIWWMCYLCACAGMATYLQFNYICLIQTKQPVRYKVDSVSTFSYDDEADPDTFSLYQLGVAIDSHFGEACHFKKLAEGGYHKVYEVLQKDGTVLGVVRVAAPAFPKDKLESEVATLKYLAAQTQIPVPQVYAWNSDASNSVGAEYIIMQKMPGVSANTKWDTLSMSVKERTVSQVTEYLKAMFALRFDRAGSLYLSSPSKDDVYVGPIVSIPFFSAVDGVVRVPDADPPSHIELSQYRGPFSNTTEYLQSFLRAELHILSQHRTTVLSELEEEADEETACKSA
ncbi:hypothetical protein F5141DRAFT_75254 [Pisolithus sp. B1]|nr:hypothetical protein F5141DRAFT_75254 [Pisolithus sp. B1]